MALDQTSIDLAIQARDRAHEVIGQATRDVEKYAASLKALKAEGDRTSDGNRRLAETVTRQREAIRAAHPAVQQLGEAQKSLTDAVNRGAEALASHAGAAGQLAASFGGVALAGAAVVGALAAIGAGALAAA